MNKTYAILGLLGLLLGGTIGGIFFDTRSREAALEARVAALSSKIVSLESSNASFSQKITQEVSDANQLGQKSLTLSEQALQSKTAAPKSQDELLTAAVAKNAPAVVSIVISKDLPQLQVTYVNPFGDDPNYQDFGFRVPVYRQVGTAKQQIGAGSGFIVTSDGYILTNKHVVFDDEASYTALLSTGKQETAKVIYKDPNQDIAILKIDGGPYPSASIGTDSSVKLGQTVVAIGNALGEYNNSVSVGIISGLNRTITASDSTGAPETISNAIQTDAAINPGNSGGPLLDLSGTVIGLNVATVSGASNIGFSIPIDAARSILREITGR